MKILSKLITNATTTTMLVVALVTGLSMIAAPAVVAAPSWVATWGASPQRVWGPDFLFSTNVPPELHDQTVR